MKRDLIVVGASAGGVEALRTLAAGLPPDLPAAVLVVLHVSPMNDSALPAILNRSGKLPAAFAQHEEALIPGRIYVARPDYHLIVEDGHLKLSRGPREHAVRPAVDPLFRSAALARGPRAVGVILTGALDDGTIGMMAIKAHGGVTVVQDPEEAMFAGMPASALASVPVDYVLPLSQVAGVLAQLVGMDADEPSAGDTAMSSDIEHAADIIARDMEEQERGERSAEPSVYTCPGCNGVMWQINSGRSVLFQCHIGHAYSLQSLLVEHAGRMETLLWNTTRALQEKASLARQALNLYGDRLDPQLRQRFQEQERLSQEQMEKLRALAEHPYFSDTQEYQAVEKLAVEQAIPPPVPPDR